MSFIVKGIDLPRNFPMQLTIYPNGEIRRTVGDVIAYCGQAIQIPKDHGRLIDGDRFVESNECCGWIEDMTVETFNKLTPTILEAEE